MLDECEGYELIWETRTAQPVRLLCFSPDGTLFATAGQNDMLLKVWFQDKPCKFILYAINKCPNDKLCSFAQYFFLRRAWNIWRLRLLHAMTTRFVMRTNT